MSRRSFIYIFFITLLAVYILLGFFSKVFADTLEISSYDGTGATDDLTIGGSWFFQSFTPTTTFSISKVGFEVYGQYSTQPANLWVELKLSTGQVLASTTARDKTTFPSGFHFEYFIFPTPYPLTASTTYFLQFNGDTTQTGLNAWRSSRQPGLGDIYSGGCGGGGSLGNFPNCATYGDIEDKNFEIYSAPTNSIQIDYPVNGTSTPHIVPFSYSGYSLLTPPSAVLIKIGTSSSTIGQYGLIRRLDETGAFDFENDYLTSALNPDTTYYARAWLVSCLNYDFYSVCIPSTWENNYVNPIGYFTAFATSSIVNFNTYEATTTTFYEGYYPIYTPTSTATSSEWVITCDPDDPLWSRSICQISKWTLEGLKGLLQFLFVPKQQDLVQFSELKGLLENKPPIGYFNIIKNAWENNLSSTSTPAFILQSATSTLAAPVYNPLKTGFTSILWLSAGMFVFNRIRHFIL